MRTLFNSLFSICSLISIFLPKLVEAQTDSSKALKEVFIQAIRANSRLSTSSSLLKVKDIQHVNLGQDVPTMLQLLPSISNGSDAGNGIGYSYLYLRGMDAQRIQVNINGVPYNDAESQEVYWVNIPDILSSAEDIQVQRGVGFSTMGGTGLGGSLSIKTTKKYAQPFAQWSTSIGSFNTLKTSVSGSTGILDNGWQITARGSLLRSEGYIDRAWTRLGSLYLDISKYGERYTTHLIATHGREKTYQAWYGVSQQDYENGLDKKNIAGTDYESKSGNPYENQIDNYFQSHVQWIHNFLWQKGHQSSLTGYFSQGKGYYEEYKVDQKYKNYSSNLTGRGDLVRQLWLDNYLVGFNASHQIEKGHLINTTAFSINHYFGNHFGRIPILFSSYTGTIPDEFYHNNSDKFDLTVFNKISYVVGKSTLSADIQLRHVSYSAGGILRNQSQFQFDKEYWFFNPKIAWNIQPSSKDKIYVFLGLSHREPVRSDFLDEESSRMPKPEEVYDAEIGYEKKWSKSTLKVNGFAMYFVDQLIPTGNVNSVGAPIRENVHQSCRAGIEAEWNIQFSNKLSFYTNQYLALNKILNYTNYLITYNEDYSINEALTVKQNFASTDIAFSPSWISYAELHYSPWAKTHIRLINKIVGKQYLDNTASDVKSLPLYTFTNLSLSHTLTINKFMKSIDLNLLLNNLMNQRYISRGYTYFSGNMFMNDGSFQNGADYNYYFPQAGFNFLMGITMRW